MPLAMRPGVRCSRFRRAGAAADISPFSRASMLLPAIAARDFAYATIAAPPRLGYLAPARR